MQFIYTQCLFYCLQEHLPSSYHVIYLLSIPNCILWGTSFAHFSSPIQLILNVFSLFTCSAISKLQNTWSETKKSSKSNLRSGSCKRKSESKMYFCSLKQQKDFLSWSFAVYCAAWGRNKTLLNTLCYKWLEWLEHAPWDSVGHSVRMQLTASQCRPNRRSVL